MGFMSDDKYRVSIINPKLLQEEVAVITDIPISWDEFRTILRVFGITFFNRHVDDCVDVGRALDYVNSCGRVLEIKNKEGVAYVRISRKASIDDDISDAISKFLATRYGADAVYFTSASFIKYGKGE